MGPREGLLLGRPCRLPPDAPLPQQQSPLHGPFDGPRAEAGRPAAEAGPEGLGEGARPPGRGGGRGEEGRPVRKQDREGGEKGSEANG